MDAPKTRTCQKCRQELSEDRFVKSPCKFFPGRRSYICTNCLERMVKQDNLNEVDALCRYLDLPFDIDRYTFCFKNNPDHALTAYFNTLLDEHYAAISWADENERWRLARESQTLDEEVEVLSEAKTRQLKKTWSGAYSREDLNFLDNYYNRIIATQNVSTPILQEYARDLCEVELQIKKILRGELAGADIKKLMDARDNIIKIAHFEATNAKNAADFESIGELMVYFGKKGWHPNWHIEPQDSVDFCMQNIQTYLRRLVSNEGNFADQVEDKRAHYNMTERLENLENEAAAEPIPIEYEGDFDDLADRD